MLCQAHGVRQRVRGPDRGSVQLRRLRDRMRSNAGLRRLGVRLPGWDHRVRGCLCAHAVGPAQLREVRTGVRRGTAVRRRHVRVSRNPSRLRQRLHGFGQRSEQLRRVRALVWPRTELRVRCVRVRRGRDVLSGRRAVPRAVERSEQLRWLRQLVRLGRYLHERRLRRWLLIPASPVQRHVLQSIQRRGELRSVR
jgi:hypothetical protein